MSHETESASISQAKGRPRFSRLVFWIGIVFVTIVLTAIAVFSAEGLRAPIVTEIQTYNNLDPAHTTEAVSYPQSPPVGGPHDPVWQNCGIYESPVRNENAVHSLEHGAVWLTYRPDLPAEEIASLQELVSTRRYIVLSPYPELPAPVIATAWGVQLQLENPRSGQLVEFITQYLQGPQSPEPGAPCVGGLGAPL